MILGTGQQGFWPLSDFPVEVAYRPRPC